MSTISKEKVNASSMKDLLDKMNRDAVIVVEEEKGKTVPANEKKEKSAKKTESIPKGLYCSTLEEYSATYLQPFPKAKQAEPYDTKGLTRVILNRENSYDVKFLCAIANITYRDFIDNIVREHIKAHSHLFKQLCRPAQSWEQRRNGL